MNVHPICLYIVKFQNICHIFVKVSPLIIFLQYVSIENNVLILHFAFINVTSCSLCFLYRHDSTSQFN